MESICTSEKGRQVWAVTLTNKKSGPALSKPALYIDGNTHAGEVAGSMAAMHTMDVLCTGYDSDASLRRLLDEMTFYIIPRISVDGTEVYLHTPARLRSADIYGSRNGLTEPNSTPRCSPPPPPCRSSWT